MNQIEHHDYEKDPPSARIPIADFKAAKKSPELRAFVAEALAQERRLEAEGRIHGGSTEPPVSS